SPVGSFVADRCVVGRRHAVPVKELYGAWREWCESNGRDRPGDAQHFGRMIRAFLPGVTTRRDGLRGQQTRVYEGVNLTHKEAF
nr:NTP-binding protein [Gemmatimonadaceae bacterium]